METCSSPNRYDYIDGGRYAVGESPDAGICDYYSYCRRWQYGECPFRSLDQDTSNVIPVVGSPPLDITMYPTSRQA
jgi:hypothetical protein